MENRNMSIFDRLFSKSGVPVILQTEQAECGLACLAMIASYHGYKTDLSELRRTYSLSLKGASLGTLIDIAKGLNFITRPLRVELEDLSDIRTPAILHWDMNHFVVLTKLNRNGAIIHDPSFGERTISYKSLGKHFTGVLLELVPGPDFSPKKVEKKISITRLFGSVSGLRRTFLQIVTISLILQLLVMAPPYYSQLVLDDVIVRMDSGLLKFLLLIFLTLAVMNALVEILRSKVILHFSSQLNYQMGSGLFWHLINLPTPFFEKRHMGDIVSRFESLEKIRRFLTEGVVQSVIDGLMCSITLSIMMFYSPTLTGIVLIFALLYVVLRSTIVNKERTLCEELITCTAKEQSHFMETVRGIQSIKMFGHENSRFSLWQEFFVKNINANILISQFQINARASRTLLFGVENVILLFYGANMVINSTLTIGMLIAFISYKMLFIDKIGNFIDKLIEFRMLKLHLARIADIAIEKKEASELTNNFDNSPAISGQVSFYNLSFKYSSSEPAVFSNLTLEIKAGESVALTGASGAGKSTLFRILTGLQQPTSGDIYIDDINIRNLAIKDYRKNIAAVMQDDQLLSGSIWQNICFFDKSPDHEWIQECAKVASIHDDILSMPMGYHSLIGDMGTTLSGGQKQRVLFARALYKRPKILFLDEATSNLDTLTEDKINRSVSKLNITRFIIAHRPDTIRSADRILQLEQNCITEVTDKYKNQTYSLSKNSGKYPK